PRRRRVEHAVGSADIAAEAIAGETAYDDNVAQDPGGSQSAAGGCTASQSRPGWPGIPNDTSSSSVARDPIPRRLMPRRQQLPEFQSAASNSRHLKGG